MKKILLVGWKGSNNFGSNLQAIALYKTLNKNEQCGFFVKRRYYPFGTFIKKALKKIAVKLFSTKDVCTNNQRNENIQRCYNDFNCVSINTKKQLKNVLNEYSVYVVGSDQVWNPYYLQDTYLLDFVPKGYRKISYSSSIGVSCIPKKFHKKYKKYLNDFSWISMREQQGAKCLGEVLSRNIDVVLDPTFLLTQEEWNDFAKDYREETKLPQKYLLCYFVGNKINYWKQVKEISRKLNMPIVILPMNEWDFSCDNAIILKNAGPKEFVHLVKDASYICTDSFHMCAFSINYNKQFSVFKRFASDDIGSQNSRIDNLLETFKIDRYYNGELHFISYDNANEILDRERKRCKEKLWQEICD